jgi:hypothetical protein
MGVGHGLLRANQIWKTLKFLFGNLFFELFVSVYLERHSTGRVMKLPSHLVCSEPLTKSMQDRAF